MSKTIYYIGAGASYGKRNENGGVIEGIPLVAEIPKEFSEFRECISKAEIPQGEISFLNKYVTESDSVKMKWQRLLSDIDSLIDGINEHATIDTYARKLYLTRDTRMFNILKDVLCTFFVWVQLDRKPDNRYDTFLANILEMESLVLPKDISIISWNYDSQIEMAFKSYQSSRLLPVYEKNIQGEWPPLYDCGRIFKVNGSATFVDTSLFTLIKDYSNTSPAILLIMFYDDLNADTTEFGYQFRTHLSFAWEDSPNALKMRETIKATVADTEQMVVVGYSFPFFNRETDREIIGYMDKLKKIYVQDIVPNAVKESVLAVLPVGRKIDIVPISNCSQFYLPSEL